MTINPFKFSDESLEIEPISRDPPPNESDSTNTDTIEVNSAARAVKENSKQPKLKSYIDSVPESTGFFKRSLNLARQCINSVRDALNTATREETPLPVKKNGKVWVQRTDITPAQQKQFDNELFHALISKDYHRVALALKNGANPNSEGKFHDPPLFFLGTIETTKLLLEYGANPNHFNSKRNMTVLCDAIDFNHNIENIKLLLLYGADPNWISPKGDQPILKKAINLDNAEIVKLLVQYGAKIANSNRSDSIIYATEINRLNIAKKLYEMVPEGGEYTHTLRMLVYRFALAEVAKHEYSGYAISVTNKEFVDSAHQFLANNAIHPKIDKDKILRSCASSLTSNTALEKVDRGEIVSLQTAWASKLSTHSISAAVFKAGNDYFFIKGNRGGGRNDDQHNVEIFKIGKPQNLDAAINKIRANENTADLGQPYFTKGINDELQLTPYPNSNENGISHKAQSMGNCSWASVKLIMEMVTYASLLQNGVNHSDAKKIANALYKDFTSFDRKQAIDEFLIFLEQHRDKLGDEKLKRLGLPTVSELILTLIQDLSILKEHESVEKLLKVFLETPANQSQNSIIKVIEALGHSIETEGISPNNIRNEKYIRVLNSLLKIVKDHKEAFSPISTEIINKIAYKLISYFSFLNNTKSIQSIYALFEDTDGIVEALKDAKVFKGSELQMTEILPFIQIIFKTPALRNNLDLQFIILDALKNIFISSRGELAGLSEDQLMILYRTFDEIRSMLGIIKSENALSTCQKEIVGELMRDLTFSKAYEKVYTLIPEIYDKTILIPKEELFIDLYLRNLKDEKTRLGTDQFQPFLKFILETYKDSTRDHQKQLAIKNFISCLEKGILSELKNGKPPEVINHELIQLKDIVNHNKAKLGDKDYKLLRQKIMVLQFELAQPKE